MKYLHGVVMKLKCLEAVGASNNSSQQIKVTDVRVAIREILKASYHHHHRFLILRHYF